MIIDLLQHLNGWNDNVLANKNDDGKAILIKFSSLQDVLLSSLEADLATYKALATPTTSDNTRIQNLQRSISTHEVAMVSLKKEFQRQSEELSSSQSEARRLRDLLDKKVGDRKWALLWEWFCSATL